MKALQGCKPESKLRIRGRSAPLFSLPLSPGTWVRRWPEFSQALFGLAVLILAGCASPEADNSPPFVVQKPLPPARVLVHEFIVEPGGIPVDASIGARLASGAPLPPEQVTIDRKLAADMTEKLIAAMRNLGLPVERGKPDASLQVHDVVVRGCFISMHDTNAAKRFTVGFDFEAAEFLTMIEPFQVTSIGVRHGLVTTSNPTGIIATSGMKVGDKYSARARLDGWAERTVNEAAEKLKILFQEQGWIK
jgi:hypothetical protein